MEKDEWLALNIILERKRKKLEKIIKIVDQYEEENILPLLTKLKENCPHLETEKKSHYFPGGYLDKESWEEYVECKFCHTKSEPKITMGGYG